ncbi:MAG TPA: mechanosensitive ion channel domain-containing protein [Candidatus Methylomirabilis sp.]|nr:mechanosensitive ion channel domain-containing protein [Candidatus Methylomirabilis sp.]
MPEIAQRAEEVMALARQSADRLAADSRIQDVENRLADASEWIRARLVATTEALHASPSEGALTNLTDSWTLMRGRLADLNQTLTRVAIDLDRELSQFETLRAAWSVSHAEGAVSSVPAPVLERINATLTAIILARDRVAGRRAHVLLLQDRVVKEMARCDDVLGEIAHARGQALGPVLTRDSVPIWSPEARVLVFSNLGQRLRRSFRDAVELATQYLAGQAARVLLQVVVFVVALVLLGRARARARRREANESGEPPGAPVFEAPISAALVVTLLAMPWIYLRAPRAVTNLVALLYLVPVVLMARQLLPPGLFPAVYALASFFLVDRVRELCAEIPVLEQRVFLVEMVFGIAFLALALRSERLMTAASGQPASGSRRTLGWVLWADMAILACAVVAGALGHMRLARSLGTLVLASSYAALVLYAGVRIGDGLWAFVLRTGLAARLRMVDRHRELLQRRVGLALRWLAVGTWGYFILVGLGVAGAVGSAVGSALNARYARGSVSLSAGDVVAFGLTVCAAFLVSSFVRFVLREEIYPRTRLAQGQSYALSSLLHYAVILVGFLLAVSSLGVDLTRVTILAGAFGVGIGIGLQNVVANFVAGVILLLEQRVHVGDSIEAGDLQGEVQEIGFRASTVRTWSGGEVIVPNSRFTSERVTNWTLSDRKCRVDLNVTVAYTAETAQVLEVLRKTAEVHPRVLAEPRPLAVCTGFRENGLGFDLRAWTRFEDGDIVRSELALAVHTALAAAKIEIGVPQRDVHIWSARREAGDLPRQQSSP